MKSSDIRLSIEYISGNSTRTGYHTSKWLVKSKVNLGELKIKNFLNDLYCFDNVYIKNLRIEKGLYLYEVETDFDTSG